MCGGGGSSTTVVQAADPAPVAAASKESAEIGAQLGREQLAEARRQYDLNLAIGRPIVDAQTGLMNQAIRQGDDYYNYMVAKQRPVENALNAQSMQDGTDTQQQEYADRAIADSMNGYTRALNTAARQGLRYGFNSNKLMSQAGTQAAGVAQAQAAAANAGREQSRNLGWARKLDVAGLYRGLPGASQGAYATSINAGNSAMSNQMAPGNALLGGMAQGAGMTQTGLGQQLNGLMGVYNGQNQVGIANAQMANQANMNSSSNMAGIIGAGIGLASKIPWSDRRLKDNIELVGRDEKTDLPLYTFSYKFEPGTKYLGVMADDVAKKYPKSVVVDPSGYMRVNYASLGLEMRRV